MAHYNLMFRFHAIDRMHQYDIVEVDVREVLESDNVIEGGQDQFGMPRKLYLGFVERRPIHVATIDDHDARPTEITTVYEPNLNEWNPGFRTRRNR